MRLVNKSKTNTFLWLSRKQNLCRHNGARDDRFEYAEQLLNVTKSVYLAKIENENVNMCINPFQHSFVGNYHNSPLTVVIQTTWANGTKMYYTNIYHRMVTWYYYQTGKQTHW